MVSQLKSRIDNKVKPKKSSIPNTGERASLVHIGLLAKDITEGPDEYPLRSQGHFNRSLFNKFKNKKGPGCPSIVSSWVL